MAILTQKIDLNINDVAQKITVDVNIIGYKGWLIRLNISIFLIKLACWIAGVTVVFK